MMAISNAHIPQSPAIPKGAKNALPLRIVIAKDNRHLVMVGNRVVRGMTYIGCKIEDDPVAMTMTIQHYMQPKTSRQKAELELEDFTIELVDKLGDVFKPRWLLRLNRWWKKVRLAFRPSPQPV